MGFLYFEKFLQIITFLNKINVILILTLEELIQQFQTIKFLLKSKKCTRVGFPLKSLY